MRTPPREDEPPPKRPALFQTPPTTERSVAIARPCPTKMPPLHTREIALRTICDLNLAYETSSCVVQALAVFDAFARTPEHSFIWTQPDAGACFMIACKFREVRHPLISDVAHILKVRALFVRESEVRVLNALGWRVPFPTLQDRVECLLALSPELDTPETGRTAVFLAELAVSAHAVVERFSEDALAAGVIACLRRTLLGSALDHEGDGAASAIHEVCLANGFIPALGVVGPPPPSVAGEGGCPL